MRIIAGKARSLPLKTIPGQATRPTTDRIKETLFNMLQQEIPGACFLDLFAGSGAIGLEAVSRGASKAVFVEQNKSAAACIRENISFTGFNQECVLLPMDVFAALKSLEGKEKFDIVFMDPPYDKALEQQVLKELSGSGMIDGNTKIIAEASLSTDFSYVEELGCEIIKVKKYKTNVHVFIQKRT